MRLSDLKPAEYNPRRIDGDAAEGLRRSMEAFGDIAGIVWNKTTGNLVSGHQRVSQLREAHGDLDIKRGYIETPDGNRFSVRIVEWDEGTERAANVAANNPHIGGHFTEGLDGLLAELKERDGELYDALKFEPLEDMDLGPDVNPEPDVIEDEVPEPPADPVTKRGDLWLLGDHRLLCGDCTDAAGQSRIGASEAVAMLTDPPYGMGDSRMRDGGDASVPNAAAQWDMETFDIRRLPVRRYKTLIWGAQFFGAAPLELGLMTWSCWDKMTREMGAVRHGALELACANFGKSQVWPIMWGPYQSMRQRVDHPTPKPVELVAKTVELATDRGEAVFEPFAGGGSMIVACEQMERRCAAMELEPRYCDVIVERWEQLTGGKAKRAGSA